MDDKEPIVPLHKRITKHRAFLPFTLFIVVVILFSFSSQFSDRPPVIKLITPEVGYPGDILVLVGKHFGKERKGGEVTIAGARPVSASYLEWHDERISVRIPGDAGSGMVNVITRNGKSKGVLFTNRNHIPIVLSGPAQPGHPFIENITPTKGSVGTLITITGLNFGLERGGGKVFFTPVTFTDSNRQVDESDISNLISSSESDFDYESWSDREIKVRVPDGASPGNIAVLTDRGLSNFDYFEVTSQAGTKLLKQKRGYQVQYGVQVRITSAEPGSSLFLWIPRVYQGLEQSNMEVASEIQPYWNDFRGVIVYKLDNLTSHSSYNVSQSFWFDRYAVETRINISKIPEIYDKERRLFRFYTTPDSFVPSDDEKIKQISKSLVRGESNPYLKARRIYDYLIQRFSFVNDLSEKDILAGMNQKTADSYTYALLFCALSRAAGIPSRPVAGYVVYGDKLTARHFWAEFYIESVGWIPVDPALGDGAAFGNFPEVEDQVGYYFGNLDNQHIILSRGVLQVTPIQPHGKTIRKSNLYTLQTIHEEASPNLESYSTLWQDLRVVDWW
ncbi:MAG: transglutaminase domain-containing protein [Spirochaetota bacterium]